MSEISTFDRSDDILDGHGSAGNDVMAAQIDFAHVFRDHLLLYGWVFGLSHSVASVALRHGESTYDLLSLAIKVPRPDVTKHFSSKAAPAGDEHGFFLMLPSTHYTRQRGMLKLTVLLRTGETFESTWPVGRGELAFVAFFRQNQATFDWLLSHLKPVDAKPLVDLASAALPAAENNASKATSALPLEFEVDLCCILENRILLIVGWLIDPDQSLTAANVRVGDINQDFLGGLKFNSRPDIAARFPAFGGRNVTPQFGFTYLSVFPVTDRHEDEVIFNFRRRDSESRVVRELTTVPSIARVALAELFSRLDSDAAISLLARISTLLDNLPKESALLDFLKLQFNRAVERLPGSLECRKPRLLLHLDRVIAIGHAGVFLNGWFNAEQDALGAVACHNGVSGVAIDASWTRHARTDVSAHLAKLGVAAHGHDHGFACYVPLKSDDSPYYISVTESDGTIHRIRMPTLAPQSTALESARAVLTSFNIEHRALRDLLDRHIGPAVRTAWANRDAIERTVTLQRFGAEMSKPQISVIVPLYGRFDLAEYQLALFADDSEFQHIELIYFVDDPTIYDEFRFQCADLFALYQVPFTVAFCGANLGFAGANNCAASIARGRHLLLLNSDVFPMAPGWAGAMLKIYAALQNPGLLGVKLLFEDGSVQHAGMSFRRHAPWGDLWINHHPYKGQSAEGLHGVREVDAVTAACILVDAELYGALGGLSEDYIVGDFEDSDLCLRVAATGRKNRVALDIEMYHLERQSQDRIGDSQWRTNLTIYNCWQHHHRWAAQIESLGP